MNVFDFAMKMEAEAEAFYRKLAGRSSLPGVKRIFADLAEDEQKHFAMFRQLKADAGLSDMEDSRTLDHARTVFGRLLEEKADIASMQDDLESYHYAMKLEAEGVRFYEDAARREKDAGVQALLLHVAAEERKHFNVVENIYRFVNAPNEYLAWAEFSSPDEFHAFGRNIDL
jgi:rubrerythrin